MSIHRSLTETLKRMIKSYSVVPHAVIETFYYTASCASWDELDIISMLEAAKGIDVDADRILDKFIRIEKQQLEE